MFLLCGDLGRGEPRRLEGFFEPLGQQSWTVSVQAQQHVSEVLGQAARGAAPDRLGESQTAQ